MPEEPQEAVGVPGLLEQARVQLGKLRRVLGRRPQDADVAIVDGAGHGAARGKERSACGLTSGGRRYRGRKGWTGARSAASTASDAGIRLQVGERHFRLSAGCPDCVRNRFRPRADDDHRPRADLAGRIVRGKQHEAAPPSRAPAKSWRYTLPRRASTATASRRPPRASPSRSSA